MDKLAALPPDPQAEAGTGPVTPAEAERVDAAPASERQLVLYDPLRRYLAEIRQFHALPAEEEHALAMRYRDTGDLEAVYKLVTSQLRLVVRIAFEFKRSWLNLLDLIQEGNVGLLLAVQKFDPLRGIRLSTYAAWWIRAYMIRFLLDNWRLVKVGTTNARRRLLFNLKKEKELLEQQGIVPKTKLLAERLDTSEEDVIEVERSLGMNDVSIEAPTGPESGRSLLDTLASQDAPVDEQAAASERRDIINRKLDEFAQSLPEREQIVFRQRLVAEEPATLQELGERFGLTREGLRQVEKRLLKKLKEFLESELDLAGLDITPRGVRPARPAPARSSPTRLPAKGA